MNRARIEQRLRVFAASSGLTPDQAEELKTILEIMADEQAGAAAPVSTRIEGSTRIDTGINVSAPTLTVTDIVRMETEHQGIVEADVERKRAIARSIITGAAGLAGVALTGGSGSAVAGAALTALRGFSR